MATSETNTKTGSLAPEGSWPIIDRELVTDYGKPVSDALRQFFRIHMDIPISDPVKFADLRQTLDSGKEGEVYTVVKSTLPSENSVNKRAHALVDAALKPTTTTTNTAAGSMAPLGSWPIIDRELVTDYAKPVSDALRQFFRIHMDVPISDPAKFADLRKALDSGREDEVYTAVKSTLPSENPENKRAYAVVNAALNSPTR
jgi:hypothetical protein